MKNLARLKKYLFLARTQTTSQSKDWNTIYTRGQWLKVPLPTRSEEVLSLSRQKGQKWMKCLPSFSLLSIEVITVIRRPPCLACQHLFDVAGQNVITPPIGKSVRENNPPLQRFVQFKLENTKIQKRAAEKNAQIAPTELHCERVMGLRMKEGDRQRKDHRFRERKGQNEARKGGNQPVLDAL